MLILVAACVLAAAAWVYLLMGHGGFWRTDVRLPRLGETADLGHWPSVVAVVPARDEAAILPETLPTLLGQDYPGRFSVVLVDDGSTDGTSEVARALAQTATRQNASGSAGAAAALRVVAGGPPPAGWAGKVWAMAQGVTAAGECDYLLFTDADIAFEPQNLAHLVRAAVTDDRALVSQMALLRAESGWERWIVPACVYCFA